MQRMRILGQLPRQRHNDGWEIQISPRPEASRILVEGELIGYPHRDRWWPPCLVLPVQKDALLQLDRENLAQQDVCPRKQS